MFGPEGLPHAGEEELQICLLLAPFPLRFTGTFITRDLFTWEEYLPV